MMWIVLTPIVIMLLLAIAGMVYAFTGASSVPSLDINKPVREIVDYYTDDANRGTFEIITEHEAIDNIKEWLTVSRVAWSSIESDFFVLKDVKNDIQIAFASVFSFIAKERRKIVDVEGFDIELTKDEQDYLYDNIINRHLEQQKAETKKAEESLDKQERQRLLEIYEKEEL